MAPRVWNSLVASLDSGRLISDSSLGCAHLFHWRGCMMTSTLHFGWMGFLDCLISVSWASSALGSQAHGPSFHYLHGSNLFDIWSTAFSDASLFGDWTFGLLMHQTVHTYTCGDGRMALDLLDETALPMSDVACADLLPRKKGA